MKEVSLVWHRLDLRLADNPALIAAAKRGVVVPIFIHAPEEETPWSPGGASLWWLHQSLAALDVSLRKIGSCLIIRRGATLVTLQALIKETGATAVFWNRRYEPAVTARDTLRLATRGGAEVLGRDDVGYLAPGMAADIVIFSETEVNDRATFLQPHQYSTGFKFVLVNGKLTVENGIHTGVRGGYPLYGPGRAVE